MTPAGWAKRRTGSGVDQGNVSTVADQMGADRHRHRGCWIKIGRRQIGRNQRRIGVGQQILTQTKIAVQQRGQRDIANLTIINYCARSAGSIRCLGQRGPGAANGGQGNGPRHAAKKPPPGQSWVDHLDLHMNLEFRSRDKIRPRGGLNHRSHSTCFVRLCTKANRATTPARHR